MMINPPPPIDSQTLQFKELFKLKTLSDTSKKIYHQPTQLIVASSNYGSIFIGERSGIKAILTNKLYEEEIPKLSRNVVDKYTHRNIALPSAPSHMDINSDQKRLAVTFCQNNSPVLRVYSVESFFQANVTICNEVRLSAMDATFVVDLSWNPAIPNIISCCVSDGTLSVYTFYDNGTWEIKSLARELCSTCVCWSPKGKQIVVGNGNGYLTRYSPELTPVQNFPPPTSIFGKPCTLCSVKWLSSFQFICAYKLQNNFKDEDGGNKLSVIVVNTPKNAPVQYVNYEDPCFSSGSERASQFYFIHVPRWSVIFVMSSNGVELAVLGLNQDGVSWSLWNLDEGTRVQLPMCKGEETFPVGVCIDYSSQIQTPVGENIITMPTLSLLTCEGLLCVYLVNNMNPSCPSICEKPAVFSPQYFTSSCVVNEQPAQVETSISPVTQPFIQNNAIPTFTSGIPTHTFQSTVNTACVSSTPPKDTVPIPAFVPVSFESRPPNTAPTPPATTLANLLSACTSLFNVTSPASALQTILSTNVNVMPTLTTTNVETTALQQTMQTKTIPDVNAQKLAADAAKAKIEQMKQFRKISHTFETEIQEIKSLVETIRVENDKSNQNEKYDNLWANIKKLKISNSNLHEDVDLVKQLIIEIFARVQDIKTKHWQYTNAKYQNLANIQDLDTTSMSRLKHIGDGINYVRSQIDKANKLLDEVWFKFSERNTRSGKSKMQLPVVDNIYETIVKQQKIFKMLQLRAQQYEKKIHSIDLLIAKTHSKKSPIQIRLDTALKNDWYSTDLTETTMNLRITDEDEEDPQALARKYCIQHAERFHLSTAKRLKLQELHSSMNNITYIQSNRLQKLKKKSLIMLSKNSRVEGTSSTPASPVMVASEPSPIDESRTRAFSPINSDEFDIKSIDEKIVSSTPIKTTVPKSTFTHPLSLVPELKANTPEVQIKPIQSEISKETIASSKVDTTNIMKPTPTTDVQVFASVPNLIKTTQPAITSSFESILESVVTASSVTIAASSAPKTDVTASTFSFGFSKNEPLITPSTSIFAGQGTVLKPQISIFRSLGESTISPITVSSTSISTASTTAPSLFGGTGSIFKAKTIATTTTTTSSSPLTSTINFGSILSSNLTTNASKTPSEAAPITTKSDTFSTFSFANVATSGTTQQTATIPKTEPVVSKEITNVITIPTPSSAASNFSFSSISSFTPIKTSVPSSNTLSMPTMVKPEPTETLATELSSSSNSTLSNIPCSVVSTAAKTPPPIITTPSTSSVTISPVPTTASPQKATPFESSGSFLGELSLGSVLAATSAPSSVFGNIGSASTSTASIFKSGGNIFSQNTNVAPTSTSETKSLFGGSSIFGGQSNTTIGETTATGGETSNLLNTSQSTSNFASGGQGSIFGSASIFGGGGSFVAPTSMTNSFAPANTSSGSLFGSGNSFSSSPFQNAVGAFGSSSFTNTPQQPQENTSGGFGAPPAFSGISAFNKPAFGGAPTFGGSPRFGTSPPKLFGQSVAPINTYVNPAPSQPTVFENIASENTMTFGNLAQQTSAFGSPPIFGQTNTQPSFTGSNFGGQAFSSWR